MREAIELIDAGGYSAIVYDDTQALLEVAWADAKHFLSIESGFDVPPSWAFDHVKDAADAFGETVAQRDKQKLLGILEQAFHDGSSAADTADAMEDAFVNGITSIGADGITRTYPSKSFFQMVARTELQRAAVSGQMDLYRAAGIKMLRWQSAEPCDECAEFDDNVYAIDDVPEGGPPLHPNCRCVMIPVDDDLGDFGGTDEDRAAARRGNQPETTDGDLDY